MPASDQRIRARLIALETEARQHPRRHALRLIALAAFGYLAPVLLLSACFAILIWVVGGVTTGSVAGSDSVMLLGLLLLAAGLLGIIALVRTFWIVMPSPGGYRLPADKAPVLWQLVDEVRRSMNAPRIKHIHINADCNAFVAHRRRWGAIGPRINVLGLGAPLLASLSPEQLRIVLAHEFCHLKRRDSSIGGLIWRMNNTWDLLSAPGRLKRMRWLTAGWFVNWFSRYFAISTLPMRRLHEYRADRAAADLFGSRGTADLLMRIEWFSYRLKHEFWPAIVRQAASDPLPPNDVISIMTGLFASDPSQDLYTRWQFRERTARTPIDSVHPCLTDRLKSIGTEYDPGEETTGIGRPVGDCALALLGDAQAKACAIANTLWKSDIIARWRYEHAVAKHLDKQSKEPVELRPGAPAGDEEWQTLFPSFDRMAPAQAEMALNDFVSRYPQHPQAVFDLGRLMLQRDDSSATAVLERSMKLASENITPALSLLLEYHRSAGRDTEADAYRTQLEEHQALFKKAKVERKKVTRRDRFLPHDLPARDVEKIRRLLNAFPRVRRAHLVRKQVTLFSDQASYVIMVERRMTLTDDRRMDKILVNNLSEQLPIACATVISSRLPRSVRKRLLACAGEAVFQER